MRVHVLFSNGSMLDKDYIYFMMDFSHRSDFKHREHFNATFEYFCSYNKSNFCVFFPEILILNYYCK